MSSASTGAGSLPPSRVAVSAAVAAAQAGNAPTSGTQATRPPATTTAGTTDTAQGAQQVQPVAVAEAFNAPMLELPDNASTRDVLDGLTRAMADKSVNGSTAQRLFQLHQQIFDMEKQMLQVIMQGTSDGRAG